MNTAKMFGPAADASIGSVKMPGFTAEASLYRSENPYLQLNSAGLPGKANIIPARRLGSGQCCVRCGWGGDWCCEECIL
jgi:hypothetical protein